MREIKYNVILSRRRSISIIVSPDKTVTVRAPLRTSRKSIESFVRAKSAWIQKHLDSEPAVKLTDNQRTFSEGETFLFLGKEYTLCILASPEPFVKLTGKQLQVGQQDTGNRNTTRYHLSGWYFIKAREILTDRIKEIIYGYREYGFKPTGLSIRTLRSRWGSCSSTGKITLNSELIKLDPKFIDYVIIHELCHLRHHNHGPEFYKLLEQIVPDYKSVRKELGKFIPGR